MPRNIEHSNTQNAEKSAQQNRIEFKEKQLRSLKKTALKKIEAATNPKTKEEFSAKNKLVHVAQSAKSAKEAMVVINGMDALIRQKANEQYLIKSKTGEQAVVLLSRTAMLPAMMLFGLTGCKNAPTLVYNEVTTVSKTKETRINSNESLSTRPLTSAVLPILDYTNKPVAPKVYVVSGSIMADSTRYNKIVDNPKSFSFLQMKESTSTQPMQVPIPASISKEFSLLLTEKGEHIKGAPNAVLEFKTNENPSLEAKYELNVYRNFKKVTTLTGTLKELLQALYKKGVKLSEGYVTGS